VYRNILRFMLVVVVLGAALTSGCSMSTAPETDETAVMSNDDVRDPGPQAQSTESTTWGKIKAGYLGGGKGND